MPSYTVNEPTPTYAAGSYSHSGIGGAGNIYRVTKESQQAAVAQSASNASKSHATTSTSTRYYSGRGGAGNAHKSTPKPVLSFDETYERALAQDSAAVGHVGRGGAGNVFGAGSGSSVASGADSRRSSAEDSRSIRSGFWARISGASVGSHH